jgi:FPC/CPF motif-containing protein YcgG
MDFIEDGRFPCVGAKSAQHMDAIELIEAHSLCDGDSDADILTALHVFPHSEIYSCKFASLVVLFPATPALTEEEFEPALWTRLSALQRLDAAEWDSEVSDDPESPHFAMSFGGHGYYVVGMHPGASRIARRAPFAALVFNSHAKFRALRQDGLFGAIQQVVRERDTKLQGNTNPMLANHGERSEAAQYSGRDVPSDWSCPFKRSAG